MSLERLENQLHFILEIDKLKKVLRQTLLTDRTRNENDAEHSWHLAVMAFLLKEYSPSSDLDILKVIKMVLIHDIVEIDAGDTFCYDSKGYEDKRQREEKAAERIFNLLPKEQAEEMRELWEEFELMQSHESKFAAALDRLQPILHNYVTEGSVWRKHGVTAEKVINRNKHIQEGAPMLWEYVKKLIEDAVNKGFLKKGE